MVSRLSAVGVPLMGLTESLKQHPDVDSLYYEYDGHFTEAGNDFAAGHIAEFLVENYFPGKGLVPPDENVAVAGFVAGGE